jgi:predicted Co/Zn/Cd cation transporter (cation efflux family)
LYGDVTVSKKIKLKKKEKFMSEILSTALICCFITLFGLALGFVFLQVQANT